MNAITLIGMLAVGVNVVCLSILEVRLRTANRQWREAESNLTLAKSLIADRDDKLAEEERLLRVAASALAAATEPR